MTPEDIDRLMRFDGIIKNRLKIKCKVDNAKQFIAVQKEFGSFYNYIVSFFPEKPPLIHHFKTLDQIPATSEQSDAISRDMKKRGFKPRFFVFKAILPNGVFDRNFTYGSFLFLHRGFILCL